METDDIIYCVLLVGSLLIGHAVKTTVDPLKRQALTSLTGVVMIATVCQWDFLHSLIVAVINAAIVCIVSYKFCHVVSFIWCFGYLAFFRTTQYFGFPQVLPHSNAVQLFLTLRLVGLAFEIHDSIKLRQDRDSSGMSELRSKYQMINPSFADIMAYSFCYIGLLTGPYYKYRTYYDMINNRHAANINSFEPMMARLKTLPLIALTFLVTSHFFSIKYVKSEEFYSENPFWYRLLYMVPMFVVFRTRLYVAWIMSECICMTATLGVYPVAAKPRCGDGPTDYQALDQCRNKEKLCNESKDGSISKKDVVEYNFEAVHNLDIYGCELAPTVREGMRAWNKTVQYWLAAYVYKRLPFKSGPLRVAVTMTVSAFWHGIHPGYYLSFLTIPPNLVAEEVMSSAFRGEKLSVSTFDWICWFFKMRSLDYMCMSFLLLGFFETLNYWRSIYFVVHIYIAMFIAVGLACRSHRPKPLKDTPSKVQ